MDVVMMYMYTSVAFSPEEMFHLVCGLLQYISFPRERDWNSKEKVLQLVINCRL